MGPVPDPAAILPRRTARRLRWLDWVIAAQVFAVSFLVTLWILELERSTFARGFVGGYRIPGAVLAAAVAPVEEDGRAE